MLEKRKQRETYYKLYKAHIQPKLYPIFARYKFNNELQNQDTIDAFVTRLKLSSIDCSFYKPDKFLRDKTKQINTGVAIPLE